MIFHCKPFRGFLKIGVSPVLIHFSPGIFHEINQPAIGIPPFLLQPFPVASTLGLCTSCPFHEPRKTWAEPPAPDRKGELWPKGGDGTNKTW